MWTLIRMKLNVDGFRYRKQGSKAEHGEANVKLHVLEHNDDFFLTTTHDIANDQFIFQLAAAGMKKGIDLLNTEAKVAAYTIRYQTVRNMRHLPIISTRKTSRAYTAST